MEPESLNHDCKDGTIIIVKILSPGLYVVRCDHCRSNSEHTIGVWGLIPCSISESKEIITAKWHEWSGRSYKTDVWLILRDIERITYKYHASIDCFSFGAIKLFQKNNMVPLLSLLLDKGCGFRANDFERDFKYIIRVVEPKFNDGWSAPIQQLNISRDKRLCIQSLLSGNIVNVVSDTQNYEILDMVCNDSFSAGKVKYLEGSLEVSPESSKKRSIVPKKATKSNEGNIKPSPVTDCNNTSVRQIYQAPAVKLPLTSEETRSAELFEEKRSAGPGEETLSPVESPTEKSIHTIPRHSHINTDEILPRKNEEIEMKLPKKTDLQIDLELRSPSTGIIHGDFTLAKLPLYFTHTKLHEDIREKLFRDKIKDLTTPQKYSIPAILEKKNVLLIGRPHTRRGSGCILPLLSLVLNEVNCPNDYIISCLIICPDTVRLREYANMCHHFARDLKILEIYSTADESFLSVINGYDVVLTTPKCCLNLFEMSRLIARYLRQIFFIDIENLFTTYKPEMEGILNKTYRLPELQFVFLARSWTDYLKSISLRINLVICITSYLESLIYLKIPFGLIYEKNKLPKLLNMVAEHQDKRIAIFSTQDEQYIIRKCLDDMEIKSQDSNTTDAAFKWMPGHVLLCTDLSVIDIKVTNAEFLIHYSLPDKKSLFENRFKLATDYLSEKAMGKLRIVVIFNAENLLQFPILIQILTRMKISVPEEMKNIAGNLELAKEVDKQKPICNKLLEFGMKCVCSERHAFHSNDLINQEIANYTYLKVAIRNVNSASHYSVRLLAHTTSTRLDRLKWTKFENNYLKINTQLSSYYVSSEKFNHVEPKLGDMVAVDVDKRFYRAKVTKILKKDSKLNVTSVEVHLIDEGSNKEVLVHKLFKLPPQLCEYKSEAFHLYLTNIQPLDKDIFWHDSISKEVEKLISTVKYEARDKYFVAQVELVIGNNILIKSLYQCSHKMNFFLMELSLREFLLKSYAKANPSHVQVLKDLISKITPTSTENAPLSIKSEENVPIATEIEENVPKATEPEENLPIAEESNWLRLSKDKFYDVILSDVISTSLFFAIQANEIGNKLSHLTLMPMNIEEIKIGTICAAKYLDDWQRCLIYRIKTNNEADVLFVDYGDRKALPFSSLYSLEDINTAFKVIECEFAGINVNNNLIQLDDAKKLLLNESCVGNELKPLKLKVCEIVPKKTFADFHYKVVLIDPSDDSVLNYKMVQHDFAVWENKDIVDEAFRMYKNWVEEEEEEEELGTIPDNFDEEKDSDNESVKSDDFHAEPGYLENFAKEFFVEADPEKVTKNKIKIEKPVIKPEPTLSLANKDETPLRLLWKESERFVYITIIMSNMVSQKLFVDDSKFDFETKKGDRVYKASFKFFSRINKSSVCELKKDDSISFRFEKQLYRNWSRLTCCSCNSKMNRLDINSIGCDEEDEVDINLDEDIINLDDSSSESDEQIYYPSDDEGNTSE